MATTTKKTIAHALFWYRDPADEKVERLARRGDTVELLEADVKRGEEHGAFTAKVGQEPDAPTGSTLPDFPAEGSQQEQDSWVDAGKVDEILAYAAAHPDQRQAITDAESRRGDKARSTLIEGLAKLAGQA
jgi:hypothetical protein